MSERDELLFDFVARASGGDPVDNNYVEVVFANGYYGRIDGNPTERIATAQARGAFRAIWGYDAERVALSLRAHSERRVVIA